MEPPPAKRTPAQGYQRRSILTTASTSDEYSNNVFRTPIANRSINESSCSSRIYTSTDKEQMRKQFQRNLMSGRTITSSDVHRATPTDDIFKTETSFVTGSTTANSTARSSARMSTPANVMMKRKGTTPSTSYTAQRRTPGTVQTSRSTVTATDMGSTIVAVVEGRCEARGEVGLASIDLQSPSLILCQFSDSATHVRTVTKLHMLDPAKIVVPHTALKSNLMRELQEEFPNTVITSLPRSFFCEAMGMRRIKFLCAPEYASVDLQLTQKYYCLSAAAALLKSLEVTETFVYAQETLKVEFQGSENTTMIDINTLQRLEILQNLKQPTSGHSLFGVMSKCRVRGGLKLLRANLLQPPSHLPTIQGRLDCVQEMIEQPELFYGLQTVLGNFVDVDYLLAQCVQDPSRMTPAVAEQRINFVIGLKTVLGLIAPLQATLEGATNPYFVAVKEQLSDPRYETMLEHMRLVISDDARIQKGSEAMRHQRCFAIRPKLNGLLDVARKIYCELIEDISNYADSLAEEYNLPIQLRQTTQNGFHFVIGFGNNQERQQTLPDIFIQVQKSRNKMITCTTQYLIDCDRRAKDALEEIQSMSNIVITALIGTLRQHMGCLYYLSEAVAHLDMLVAFTQYSSISCCIRPKFSDTLAIRKGRHPILETIKDNAVPNNIYASTESNMQIVTGPNMSGKSTYLRQIALLQVVAQVGCFVPAEKASFRIADQIFSRIGTEDSIENNASTFTLEMMEMKYILQNVGNKSLVIIDELGKGTSNEEGTSISWTLCEQLIKTTAFVFVATHHLPLTKLQALYFNVSNHHFETVEENSGDSYRSNLRYTYHLTEGVTPTSNYGLRLAAMTSMPNKVLETAKEISASLAPHQSNDLKPVAVDAMDRATYILAANLFMVARNYKSSDENLATVCEELKMQFMEECCQVTPSLHDKAGCQNI